MNEIVNKFLIAGNKFMPQMDLKQQGFTYSACGPFTKNKQRIQKFKKTRDTEYIVLVDHLLKTKQELKNLKKQEIQNIFT